MSSHGERWARAETRATSTAHRGKRWTAWLALLLALGLLSAACGQAQGDQDAAAGDQEEAEAEPEEEGEALGPDVTLRLGHGFPPDHVLQQELLEPWAEEVAAATGDSVEIEIHAGGSLTEAPPAYENTVAGVADIGWSIQGYTPGRFELTEIVELPFLFESAEQATEVLWDLYEDSEALREEYGDVKVLALWTLSPGRLWTRGTEVTDLSDIDGLSLRAPGRVQIDLLERLGGNTVTMPAPEIYDALERGVMEGLVIDPVGVAAFGLADVLDHGLDASFYTSAMFLVMNQGAWDSLSTEQQAAVDELAGRELSLRIARVFDDASAGILDSIGDEIELVPVDDVSAWSDVTDEVTEDWITEAENAGHPAQELHDQLVDILASRT